MLSLSASWFLLLVALVLSQFASRQISICLPWTASAKKVNAPLFLSLAIAPLLLGFNTILVLKLMPQQSHFLHLALILGLLSVWFVVFRACSRKNNTYSPAPNSQYALDERFLVALFFGFSLLMIISALMYPLMQTDALEYAQMGRIVFDDRSLINYPPIVPTNHPAGFYLPVTHPPLYVAMIYLANLIQGNADLPLIMRLISPWCALVTTGLVYAVGALINRRTAWFSAVLFVSTPLLFLGATSSLIDPLAVLGFCLVLTSVFFFETGPLKLGVVQGVFLGVALWTHSQAVLFPLLLIGGLLIYNGMGKWRNLILQFGSLILTSTVISFLPYWENYVKFGSIISDNPLIFQLYNLAWKDYFLIGRGVDSLSAQIQYGLFKGWFTPEAYGFIFWIVSLGFCWLVKSPASIKRIIYTILAVIVVYHLGIVLAIMLGMHQMFRIERYMLIILPCLALLGGYVLSARKMLACAMLAIITIQLAFIGIKQASFTNPMLLQFLEEIQKSLPNKAVILSTQPADMYYTGKKVVSHLDPRLKIFYEAKTTDKSWEILKNLGVTHIYIVPNALPTFYNSSLQLLVADPQYATLLDSDKGYQVYRINTKKIPLPSSNKFDISPQHVNWSSTLNWLIGGRKSLAKVPLSSAQHKTELISKTKLPLSLFQRDIATLLQTAPVIPVQSNMEYQLKVDLRGYGLIRFWLTQYEKKGKSASSPMLLSEIILSNQYPNKKASYRFKTSADVKYLQIGIEHYGNSWVEVEHVMLERQK